MKLASWAPGLLLATAFLLAAPAWADDSGKAAAEKVVPLSECARNSIKCMCGGGRVQKIFHARNGQPYMICAPTSCPGGMMLNETHTPGGKPVYSCVPMPTERPYHEPTPEELAPKHRGGQKK